MVLQRETKIGLTYGQILSTLTLLLIAIGMWVNVKVDIAKLTTRQDANDKEHITMFNQSSTIDKKVEDGFKCMNEKLDKQTELIINIIKDTK